MAADTQLQARRIEQRLRDERGVALIIALMSVLLMTALGMALTMMTMTETRIASNYRESNEALYAADAGVERVMQDLLTVPNWNNILAGTARSAFIDGAPSGTRALPDGTQLDLGQATNMVRCGKTAACSDVDMNAITDERPWGPNNPRWQLYAYAPLGEMLPTDTINSRMYVVVWVADDPSENDDSPTIDGNPPAAGGTSSDNPGGGVLSMLAHAYGPDGVRKVVEVTLARTDTSALERGYVGQRGQDEQNRRARKAAVQTPGKALTESRMNVATGGMVQQ